TEDGVTHTATAPTTIDNAKAAVADTNSTYHAGLRDEVTTYDVFGNKLSFTDAEGRTQQYVYGAFGKLISVSGSAAAVNAASVDQGGVALVVTYEYDVFGNKKHETSNYGKDITWTYDDAGHVLVVNDTKTNTKTTYTYDVAGRRATEKLEKGAS